MTTRYRVSGLQPVDPVVVVDYPLAVLLDLDLEDADLGRQAVRA
jgi:hypothetical protein